MFTIEQSQIIAAIPARTVVYAAPGSGKTTVLTHHISEQLRNHRFRANGIMAITFTRQSAVDMRKRMMEQNGMSRKRIEALQIGTFHAQLFRLLLNSVANIPVLLSPIEQFEMMKLALEQHMRNHYRISQSLVQQMLTTYSVNKASYPPAQLPKSESKIIQTYSKIKKRLNRWDFDDILQTFCRQLENRSSSHFFDTLTGIQYLLVDEYQDTNPVQWTILQRVVSELDIPVFVVGDDDQSIYGFRGASPQFLLSFATTYADARQYTLNQNFRSSPEIVEHARYLIEHNVVRAPKQMKPVRSKKGIVKAFLVPDEEAEAQYVVKAISSVKRDHPDYSCAVLSRTRRQLYKVWQSIRQAHFSGIEMRTFHDSKGREWDALFIVGLVEGNPYLARSIRNSSEMEEERRLYYVALTRARHISCTFIPKLIAGRVFKPSQFIYEAKITMESL